MACRVCGYPIKMSAARYRKLVAAGAKVACRRNGCERLVGKDARDIKGRVLKLPGVRSAVGVLSERCDEESQPIEKSRVRRAVLSDYYDE